MRVDLDRIAAIVERSRVAKAAAKLTSPLTEARLVAAMICDPWVLASADDLEVDDFADLRYRAIVAAIRTLQVRREEVNLGTILDEIERRDALVGHHVGETVHAALLGTLVIEQSRYYGKSRLVEHDMAWLRTLATRRAAV